MNTINQIGIAALTRLFSSKRFGAGRIEISKEEIDLCLEREQQSTNVHYGNIQTSGGVRFGIWSIELGLHWLVMDEECPSLGVAIIQLLLRDDLVHRSTCPTHIIINTWWSGDMVDGRDETYKIHRLSQQQELMVKTIHSERCPLALFD